MSIDIGLDPELVETSGGAEDQALESAVMQSPKPVFRQQTILLLGSRGMLGRDVLGELLKRGHEVRSPWKEDFDVTNPQRVEQLRKGELGQFDWVVNCTGYTAVDKAETDAMAAMRLNAVAPGLLAVAAQGCGARLMHVSTDFVFDGTAESRYHEESFPSPQSVYGNSKLMGERNVLKEAPDSLICRTAWLYGVHGKCFPRTMIEAYLAGKELKVVNDQRGSPTFTVDLARMLGDLMELGPSGGVYHTAGPDQMSWYDLARFAILTYRDKTGCSIPMQIEGVPTSAYPTPAKRPKFSVLSGDKVNELGIAPMRRTGEAMADFVDLLLKEKEPDSEVTEANSFD